MHTSLLFFRNYPRASLIAVFAFLFSGIAEGVGLLSFLPLLYLSIGDTGGHGKPGDLGGLEDIELLGRITEFFGSALTIQTVIPTIFVVLSLKNYLVLLANKQIGITLARISFDFRIEILRSIYRSRWEYFVGQPTGHFSGRLTNEAKRAAKTYMNSAVLVAYLAQCVTYLVLAALVSPILTAIAFPVALVAFVFSRRFITASGRYGMAKTSYIKEIAKRAVESVSGLKAIKAMGKESLLENSFFREIDELRNNQTGQITATEGLKIWQTEIVLFFMLLGLFGSFYTDWISPVEVLLLAVVLMRFFSQTTKVSGQIQALASSESAYYSLRGFLETAQENKEITQGGTPPKLEHDITFDGVSFSYGEKQVLDKLNISIKANEITTLIGSSGAGKTTVLDLIAALFEPRGGSILVDGVPLRDLDIMMWRGMIGYVPQEAFLLHDTIFNNVTLSDPAVTREQVLDALEEADTGSFIREFDGGIDFNVGERGSRLSGGQRQRIMIARALVNKPSLLIFDEATSSLDATSEQEICNTILSLRGNHTVLCASHRPALIKAADHVIDLEHQLSRLHSRGHHRPELSRPVSAQIKIARREPAACGDGGNAPQ
jgi:ATP-binding cassette subfamily C protein